MSTLIEELEKLESDLLNTSSSLTSEQESLLNSFYDRIDTVSSAWSGSVVGYQANVYYQNFQPVPSGHFFSVEWGMYTPIGSGGSKGTWKEYSQIEVEGLIVRPKEKAAFSAIEAASNEVRVIFDLSKSRFDSITTILTRDVKDEFIETCVAEANLLSIPTLIDSFKAELATYNVNVHIRDSRAVNMGLQISPHRKLEMSIQLAIGSYSQCKKMAEVCGKLISHLRLLNVNGKRRELSLGGNIFIGHGRSLDWKRVSDHLTSKHSLSFDEFNRIPIAGTTNIQRLSDMLNSASLAIIVMTAEDERTDGRFHARENVVHEVGLFQGRLGFNSTIILVEEGCETFSNIDGLGHIRFEPGRIEDIFDKVDEVLIREGILHVK